MPRKKSQRGQEILEALAEMLESEPGQKITTALLASKVGVSEAALYRHFPSKAKMFEALIVFAEDAIFGLIGKICKDDASSESKCRNILTGILVFSEKNPGISRILSREALVGEDERLRRRACQFFDRIESQLRQLLREAELKEGIRTKIPLIAAANLLLAIVEGRISQFVRTDFVSLPSKDWDMQWDLVVGNFFSKITQSR